MPHISGKAVVAIALSTIFLAFILVYSAQEHNSSRSLIEASVLGKSGIKDLDVEYVDGKIYLNVELNTPKTCIELVDSLKIQPIVIKSRTYQPSCTKISDTLMRVTYTQSISI
jgi:hypothetical protein